MKPLPPALPGLPLLGNALAFARDPVRTFQRGYRSLGPVFSVRLGPIRAAVLIGPDHHRFFFAEAGDTLSLHPVYKFVVPMFGRVLQAAEPSEYQRQRAVLQPAFAARRRPDHVEVMAAETAAWLDGLGGEGTFDLWAGFERLSMSIAGATFLGRDLRDRLGPEFWSLYRDVAGGMEFVLPSNLPLPKFRRRDRAKAGLHALLRPVIADRRGRPGGHPDFLQVLADAADPAGRPLPEETVVGMLLALVFAAYETTAAQLGWALVDLLQHPDYLARVGDELERQDFRPTPEALAGLEVLGRGLRESERMRPVTTMLWRHTEREYEAGGYRVPAGWVTIVCPPVAHRLPDVFPAPDQYDPDRFGPERAEDHRTPFALINFGGGPHRCPGRQYASSEMTVVLSLLLRRFRLELATRRPRVDYSTGLARPKSPCPVRYRRR